MKENNTNILSFDLKAFMEENEEKVNDLAKEVIIWAYAYSRVHLHRQHD